MSENEISRVIADAAVDVINSLFESQALTCLRLCDLRLALVINWASGK